MAKSTRPYVYLSEIRRYVSAITTGGVHVTDSRVDMNILVRVDSMQMDAFKALMLLYDISTKDAEGIFGNDHIWLDSIDLVENTRAWLDQNTPEPVDFTSILSSS